MDMYNPASQAQALDAAGNGNPNGFVHHRRQSSRSNSLSSVKRSASLKDTVPDPVRPSKRSSPPPHRRRSSVAHVAVEGIGVVREGVGNLNRWSQSTTSSKASAKEKVQHTHTRRSSLSRRLSITNNQPTTSPLNGFSAHPPSPSKPNSSPSRRTSQAARRSPASSPHRRARPRSPLYHPTSSVTAPPQIPSLPLLPSTVYNPSSSNTSATPSPGASGLFSANTYISSSSTDYFNSRPYPPPSNGHRPPSRSKGAGRSPLGSPPIGVLESEARYMSHLTSSQPFASSRPTTATARDFVQTPRLMSSRDRSGSRDHGTRNRSGSTTSIRREDNYQGTPPRTRERREKDKKTMLARALQKANTAVLLDNAQNFEGAIEAYEDACRLLQHVMIRSTAEEDKKKLDAIRDTYTARIDELRRLDPGYQSAPGKSLPARPMSNESLDETRSMLLGFQDDDEPAIIETATMTRIVNDRSVLDPAPSEPLTLRSAPSGNVRESVISSAIRDVQKTLPAPSPFLLQPPPGKLADAAPTLGTPGLESPMDRSYMPPPLSPRRPLSPNPPPRGASLENAGTSYLLPEQPLQSNHRRGNSNESISWLDTIDESGGSSCSSVHSVSPGGLRRKHLRNASGATEAEFDAALDAAVEAAYDEGYEPYEDEEVSSGVDIIAARLRNVELAKERVREAEREEAIVTEKYRLKEMQLRNEALPHVRESAEYNFGTDPGAEEDERLLDEMTKDFMLDPGFDFELQSKSALPRQSDSSGFSRSTLNSSVSSYRNTGGSSLATVVETNAQGKQKAPSYDPPPLPPLSEPQETLPAHPTETSQSPPASAIPAATQPTSVRSRRLSGQNAKTLKIETSLPPVPPAPHTDKPLATNLENEVVPEIPPLPKSTTATTFSNGAATEVPFKLPPLPQIPQISSLAAPQANPPVPSPADTTFTISPATPVLNQVVSNDTTLVPASPKSGKVPGAAIRKNKSSLSLKQRTLSISSPDGSDASIGTPLSTTFSFTGRKQTNPVQPLPTPSVPTFNVDGLPSGGIHLFESDIHSPYSPGSPSGAITNAPIPLEPCPESYLLRPFWLMRCFYQTIAHPRGGYLSTKLFVPRDVWRVKGVKLKNVDDKIANCDLLTAALQRLAAVDTLDADAVLEEMQALEVVLDQVQTQLSKKLGNEVGVNGVSSLLKDAHTVGAGSAHGDGSEKGSHGSQDHAPKSAMAQSKSYLSSWRKLRSKNSAVGLSSMAGSHKSSATAGNEVAKDSLTMATLPMTSLPNIRFAKRDVGSVVFEGPNAAYMNCLARLFDAVQILDQIARQVEDPGLKHSSPTHVGLELSARHAAEFFGFYICRFVLTDVTMMLDKFIKRGSEWVLV